MKGLKNSFPVWAKFLSGLTVFLLVFLAGAFGAEPGLNQKGVKKEYDGTTNQLEAELEFHQQADVLYICNSFYCWKYQLVQGRWSVFDSSGRVVLKNAYARAIAQRGKNGTEIEWKSWGRAKRSWRKKDLSDALGKGILLEVITKKKSSPCIKETFRFYKHRFFTVQMTIEKIPISYKDFSLKYLEPVHTESSGGLFLSRKPENAIILDNGSNMYFDFMVNVYPLKRPPILSRLLSPKAVSNWSQLIYARDEKKQALAGFLTADRAFGLIILDYNPELAHKEAGKRNFTEYSVRSLFRAPLLLKSQKQVSSELVYLDFFAPNPFACLEDYARAIALIQKKPVWKKPIPSGWNSWGEYHCDINEDIVLKNLDFAVRNFKPAGMNYFQIDCGYSPYWGDWWADPKRFPNGMKWLANQIRARGMTPGIWIAPFLADARSKTFKEHPDWFLPKKGILPRLLITGEGQDLRVLDLSKPEVQKHLRKVIRRYVKDWGYEWLKVDFAYYLLYYSSLPDASETVPYYYRKGMEIIREEAGDNVFVVGIGVCGFNWGLVDAQRITLDNMPAWSNYKNLFVLNPFKRFGFAQGIIPTARVVARRYWLNHNLWINHPDLIFFENDRWKEWSNRALNFNQSVAFASLVGLTGGIVKIGDRMVEMTPEQVKVIQKLLPIYPHSARPLDLFEKRTPEVWLEEVRTNFDRWWLLGLFNWGENWTVEGRHLPSRTRKYQLDFSQLGLDPAQEYLAFDFWQEKFLGKFKNQLKIAVEPESAKVIKLVPARPYPWFLSYNRHITQGAVDLKKLNWSEDKNVLFGKIKVLANFRYRLYFYLPQGFVSKKLEIKGGESFFKTKGKIAVLSLKTKGTALVDFQIKFEKN